MWLSEYAVDSSEVVPALARELADRRRLVLAVQRAHAAPGVDAVLHLAHRAERTVEAEVLGHRLDHLLQRRGDDERRLAALAMAFDQAERLVVDERPEHGLERLCDELAHLSRREAAQKHQPFLRRCAHALLARPARDEEQLPERGLCDLCACDHTVLAERRRERERRRAPQQRPVEIEERGRAQERTGSAFTMPTPSSRRVPSIASASSTIARAVGELGIGRDERSAEVALLAQPRVERDLAEERHAELLRERRSAAAPEDVARHVLDRTDQAHVRLLRHDRRTRCDLLRSGLRSRHDDDLRARQQLAERDRDVARARRHVDDEQVELAPVHVGEELLERAVQHRAAPHHRRVVVEEEADRHQLQILRHGRHDHPVDEHRLLRDPEHVRDRVSVDVRVENADLPAELRERRREVDRQRRLADAALAARDREHARARSSDKPFERPGHAAAEPFGQRSALVRRHHVELERDAFHACNGSERFGDLLLEAVAKRAPGNRERDHDDDVAPVDLDVANHLQLGDGASQLGVDHLLERSRGSLRVKETSTSSLATGRRAQRARGGAPPSRSR